MMTLAHHLRVAREQWLVILLVTLIGLGAAAAITFSRTPMYSARTQLFISVTTSQRDLTALTQGGTFTQQRVKSYADLVSNETLLQAVAAQLRLEVPPGRLADRITVTNPPDTVLLDVQVSDSDPVRAASIANALGRAFPGFVSRLETPPARAAATGGTAGTPAVSPVRISVTRAATAATVPDTPRVPLDLTLGLALGLACGIGAAVLRDALNRTVASRSDVAGLTGAPVLGVVVDDPETKRQPLIVEGGFSPRAEAYRGIRTNIRFLSVDREVRSFVVTSSIPGEGKTTTAANLALTIASMGQPVVLVEADLRRPGIAAAFGLSGAAGLTNVLLGDARVQDVQQRFSAELPLRILASGPQPPNPSELVGSSAMSALVQQLTADGAIAIFDSPGLLSVTDAAILARITDGAILVTRPGTTRTEQLVAAVEALRTVGAPILGTVLNQAPRRGRGAAPSAIQGYAPDPAAIVGRTVLPRTGGPAEDDLEALTLLGQAPAPKAAAGPWRPDAR